MSFIFKIGFLLVLLISTIIIFDGCKPANNTLENPVTLNQIEVMDTGVLDQYTYIMFKDKISGNRIVYYRGAMVVLSKE
jgi:hypothetical protein